jgi:hypothetical protein
MRGPLGRPSHPDPASGGGNGSVDYRIIWLILIVPAIILGLLSWPAIIRTVRERGLEYPSWGGDAVVLAHFRQLLRQEPDPERRRQYRRWLLMTYAATALGILWIAFVLVGGVLEK